MANNFKGFQSVFSKSTNDYGYTEESSFADSYTAMANDFWDKVSFFNTINGETSDFDTYVKPQTTFEMYDKMMQQNSFIPNYSPNTEISHYKKITKAFSYAGVPQEQWYDQYSLGKQMALTQAAKNIGGPGFIQSDILGSSYSQLLKNTDKTTYSNLFNGTAQALSTNKEELANQTTFISKYNIESYKNFNDFILNNKMTPLGKMMAVNEYNSYLKDGGEGNYNFGVQLVTDLKSNTVIDKNNKTIDIYGIAPFVNGYKNLHDYNFWDKLAWSENDTIWEKTTNGLNSILFNKYTGNSDSNITAGYSQIFMEDPLWIYLTDNSGEIDFEKAAELQASFDNSFYKDGKNHLNIQSAASVQAAIDTIVSQVGSESESYSDAKNAIKDTEFGLFLQKVRNDKYVQHVIGSHQNEINKTGVVKKVGSGVSWSFAELGNFSRYVIGNVKDGKDYANTKLMSMAGLGLGENIEDYDSPQAYTKAVSDKTKVYLDTVDAIDKSKRQALDEENAAIAGKYQKIDDTFGFLGGAFARVSNATSLGIPENIARNKEYRKNLIDDVRSKLPKSTSDQITDKEILYLASANLANSADIYLDHMSNEMKSVLDDHDYNLYKYFIEGNSDVYKRFKERQENAQEMKNKTMSDMWLSGSGDWGREKEGIKGYTQTYNRAFDRSGWLEDIFVEMAADPTSYVGLAEIKSGLEAVNLSMDAIRVTAKADTVKSTGKIVDEFLSNYNRLGVEKMSKTLGGEITAGVLDSKPLHKMRDAKDYVKMTIDESNVLYKSLSQDLLRDNVMREIDVDSLELIHSILSSHISKIDNISKKVSGSIGGMEKYIDEYNTFGKKARQGVNASMNKLFKNELAPSMAELDNITKDINSELSSIIKALPDESVVKVRLQQYLDAGVEAQTNARMFGKRLKKDLSKDLNNFISDRIYQNLNQSKLYNHASYKQAISNIEKNSNVIGEEFRKFLVDDTISFEAMLANISDKLDITTTSKLSKSRKISDTRQKVENVVQDILQDVTNAITHNNRNAEQVLKFKKKAKANKYKFDISGTINSMTGLVDEISDVNEDLYRKILDDDVLDSKVKKQLERYVSTKLSNNSDAVLVASDLEDRLRKTFNAHIKSKYRKVIKNFDIEAEDITKLMAFYSDSDTIFHLGKKYIGETISKNTPYYNDIIKGLQSEIFKDMKEFLGFTGRPRIQRVIDTYSKSRGVDFESLESAILDYALRSQDYGMDKYIQSLDFVPMAFNLKDVDVLHELKTVKRFLDEDAVTRKIEEMIVGGDHIDDMVNGNYDLLADMLENKPESYMQSLIDKDAFGNKILDFTFNKYGIDSILGKREAYTAISERMDKNIFNDFNILEDPKVFKQQLFQYGVPQSSSNLVTKGANKNVFENLTTKPAEIIRRRLSLTSETARVNNAILEAYGVTNRKIRNSSSRLLAARQKLQKRGFASTIDELLLNSRMINSVDEMTTSYHDFIQYAMLGDNTYGNLDKQILFHLDQQTANNVLQALKDIPLNKMNKDGEVIQYTLSDIFDINLVTDMDKYDEAFHSFQFTRKDIRGELKGLYDSYFKDAVDKINGDGLFASEREDVFKDIQEAMRGKLNGQFPELFSDKSKIGLIDSGSRARILGNLDKRLGEIRSQVGPKVYDEYVIDVNDTLGILATGLYDTYKSIDPTGKLYSMTDLSKYIKTLMERNPADFDVSDINDIDTFMSEAKSTLTRTHLNKKAIHKVRKANSVSGSAFDGTAQTTIRNARLKGSLSAKQKVMENTYGIKNSIITDMPAYIKAVEESYRGDLYKSWIASNMADYVKSASTTASKKKLGQKTIRLSDLKQGIFASQPEFTDKFISDLKAKGKIKGRLTKGNDLFVDMKTTDFNYLSGLTYGLIKTTDPHFMMKAWSKVNKFMMQSMLLGSFTAKMAYSGLFMATALPANEDAIKGMVNVLTTDNKYAKLVKSSPKFRELTKAAVDTNSLSELLKLGRDNLSTKEYKVWKNHHQINQLRNSSSVIGKNYGRYKSLTNSYRDSVELNLGREAGGLNMVAHTLKLGKDAIVPNFNVLDHVILGRGQQLVNNRELLNKLMKNYEGRVLKAGVDEETLYSEAMRIAEQELGVTDGLLAGHNTLSANIFAFKNQLFYGIPNIFATYFGTPDGVLSLMGQTKKIQAANRAFTQMTGNELLANTERNDYGQLMFGFKNGDADKILSVNNYSPFDIIDQFYEHNPLKTLLGSLNPLVAYPLELLNGDELGEYNSSDTNIDRFATARANSDTKNMVKYASLALLESTTGNYYRWTDQARKLYMGRTRFGEDSKDIVYLPGSTDAEIELVSNMFYKYGIDIKDGYIDELPFLSSIFDSLNTNNMRTANLMRVFDNIKYNDRYMNSIKNNEDTRYIQQAVYQAADRLMLLDMLHTGDDLGEEITKLASRESGVDLQSIAKKRREKKLQQKQEIMKQKNKNQDN